MKQYYVETEEQAEQLIDQLLINGYKKYELWRKIRLALIYIPILAVLCTWFYLSIERYI